MKLSSQDIKNNALAFYRRWRLGQKENAEAQSFVSELLDVFGLDAHEADGGFEYNVRLNDGSTGLIDFFWKKMIAIEMKSKGHDLNKAYSQLKNYLQAVPEADLPDLWLVSDFEKMCLYRRSTSQKWKFQTKELHKKIKYFLTLTGSGADLRDEDPEAVNVAAAEKLAGLHDRLYKSGYAGHELEIYLVRLLFCLFAEHTGIFQDGQFRRYLENCGPDGSVFSLKLSKLFEVLNMPPEERQLHSLMPDELKEFTYINGSLFKEKLPFADFDRQMRQTLTDCANFDWSQISPAIFGAMFQGVMDRSKRRELGAHYTSENNIMKLIKPLFLDELREEFDLAKTSQKALESFYKKITRMKFFDPACGCGNFLIIAYREMRLLELEAIKILINFQTRRLNLKDFLKIGVEQFYGIELEEFPCQIAQTGMWLMDHQMNIIASEELGQYFTRLPLTKSATIIHGNALQINWEDVVPKNELSYILGNPPFSGSKTQTAGQRNDMSGVFTDGSFRGAKGTETLDYVAGWFIKAARFIKDTNIRAAFVSTNSLNQGAQAASLWKPLITRLGIHIDFAVRSFKWSNDAKNKAAVYCAITGFSSDESQTVRKIYDGDTIILAENINPYLVDAPNVFLEIRHEPICEVPSMGIGNQPIDGGNYLFTDEEKAAFLRSEPLAEKYFRPYIGAEEFINGRRRWCLWLGECPPDELRKMPEALKRVEAVRELRLASKRTSTRKLAETPRRFQVENMPDEDFLVIPGVSSERRKIIPMGFLSRKNIASNAMLIISGVNLYHFGVLTSNYHMIWVRAVCGRLKSDYRYSAEIVYNNFPWPEAGEPQKEEIAAAAEWVLKARRLFPNSSLAALYDPAAMPAELLKAHQILDRAVAKAYYFRLKKPSDASVLAKLFERYQIISNK
jgi:hypothetical protein